MTHTRRWLAAVLAAALWALICAPAAGGGLAHWQRHAPYLSPIAPMRVEALARLPAQPWLAGHRGIDLLAGPGQEVMASAAGVVSFVGVVVDRPVLSIRHDDGALSTVEPVDAVLDVGARVTPGEVI